MHPQGRCFPTINVNESRLVTPFTKRLQRLVNMIKLSFKSRHGTNKMVQLFLILSHVYNVNRQLFFM